MNKKNIKHKIENFIKRFFTDNNQISSNFNNLGSCCDSCKIRTRLRFNFFHQVTQSNIIISNMNSEVLVSSVSNNTMKFWKRKFWKLSRPTLGSFLNYADFHEWRYSVTLLCWQTILVCSTVQCRCILFFYLNKLIGLYSTCTVE